MKNNEYINEYKNLINENAYTSLLGGGISKLVKGMKNRRIYKSMNSNIRKAIDQNFETTNEVIPRFVSKIAKLSTKIAEGEGVDANAQKEFGGLSGDFLPTADDSGVTEYTKKPFPIGAGSVKKYDVIGKDEIEELIQDYDDIKAVLTSSVENILAILPKSDVKTFFSNMERVGKSIAPELEADEKKRDNNYYDRVYPILVNKLTTQMAAYENELQKKRLADENVYKSEYLSLITEEDLDIEELGKIIDMATKLKKAMKDDEKSSDKDDDKDTEKKDTENQTSTFKNLLKKFLNEGSEYKNEYLALLMENPSEDLPNDEPVEPSSDNAPASDENGGEEQSASDENSSDSDSSEEEQEKTKEETEGNKEKENTEEEPEKKKHKRNRYTEKENQIKKNVCLTCEHIVLINECNFIGKLSESTMKMIFKSFQKETHGFKFTMEEFNNITHNIFMSGVMGAIDLGKFLTEKK